MKTFKIDMNLDDESEVSDFIETHGTNKDRSLANALGFKGKGANAAANALSGYAWNKHTAIACRERGDIAVAKQYEDICDWIYRDRIAPNIECW